MKEKRYACMFFANGANSGWVALDPPEEMDDPKDGLMVDAFVTSRLSAIPPGSKHSIVIHTSANPDGKPMANLWVMEVTREFIFSKQWYRPPTEEESASSEDSDGT